MKGLHPPVSCDLPDDWICLDKGFDFTHTGAIDIRFQHSETGTTSTITINIIQHNLDRTFQASTDWKEDLPAEGLNNKIAIWTDRHNVQYIADSESAIFEVMEPGRVYRISYGYILDDGTYVSGSFYIRTLKVELHLDLIGSLEVSAHATCNFPYELEWWSDQNPSIECSAEEVKRVDFKQKINHLHYMTIYAQIKDMPDTKTELPKIFIPFKYEGLRVEISGTSALINPHMSGVVENVSYSMNVDGMDEIFYRKYDEPVKLKGLENATVYKLKFKIHYEDKGDSSLSYVDEITEYIRTYGATESHVITTNSIQITLSQTVGAYGPDADNMILLPKLAYWKSFYCAEDGSDHRTNSSSDDMITYANLIPDKEYDFLAELTSCTDFDIRPDVRFSIRFKTLKAVEPDVFTARVTSHQVTITPKILAWNESSSLSITTKAICDDQACETKIGSISINNRSNASNLTINDLESGKGYTIEFEAIDNLGNQRAIAPIHIVTYGVKASVPSQTLHSTSMSYTTEYIDGEDYISHSQDPSRADAIYAFITELNSDTAVLYMEGISSTSQSVLIPNHDYELHVGIKNISDSMTVVPFRTKLPAQNVRYEETHTGTTITLKAKYDAVDIENYKLYTVIAVTDLDSNQRWEYNMEDEFVITGLVAGHRYNLKFSAMDSDGNTSSSAISLATAELIVTTFKLEISNLEVSTRCLKFDVSSNQLLYAGHKIYVGVSQDVKHDDHNPMAMIGDFDQGRYINNDHGTEVFDVVHSSATEITCYIDGLQDENGEDDTVIEVHTKTKRLDAEVDNMIRQEPSTIIAHWVAKSNGSIIDRDPICGERIVADLEHCSVYDPAPDAHEHYNIASQDSENNPITFNGVQALERCGVKIMISDGFNSVYSPITYTTDASLGAIRVSVDNQWKQALPFISKDNQWHKAITFVLKDNVWKTTS